MIRSVRFTGHCAVVGALVLAGATACAGGATTPSPAPVTSAVTATATGPGITTGAPIDAAGSVPTSTPAGPDTTATTATGNGPAADAAVATESNVVGDIPDTQAFVEYTSPSSEFTLTVPEGWARVDDATTVTFSDKYNSITIETASTAVVPDVQTGAAELTTLATTLTGFSPGTVTTVQRSAGPAILLTYRADSAVNPVTGKVVAQDVERYEFPHRGRVVTLTLAGPVGSDNVDPWRTVTDSLRWSA